MSEGAGPKTALNGRRLDFYRRGVGRMDATQTVTTFIAVAVMVWLAPAAIGLSFLLRRR